MEKQTEIGLEDLLSIGKDANQSPEFILLNLVSNDRDITGEITTGDLQRCIVQTRMISIIKEPSDDNPFTRVVIETVEGLTQRLCLDSFDYIAERLLGE